MYLYINGIEFKNILLLKIYNARLDNIMSTPTHVQLEIYSDGDLTEKILDKTIDYSETVDIVVSDFSVTPPTGTTLYSRVKHTADTGDSEWSNLVHFTIRELWSIISGESSQIIRNNSFGEDACRCLSSIKLSDNKLLIAYIQKTATSKTTAYASLVTIAGTTVAIASTVSLQVPATPDMVKPTAIIRLSDTYALVLVSQGSLSPTNYYFVTISGNAISNVSSAGNLGNYSFGAMEAIKLTDTMFAFVQYLDSTVTVRRCTISGTTVTITHTVSIIGDATSYAVDVLDPATNKLIFMSTGYSGTRFIIVDMTTNISIFASTLIEKFSTNIYEGVSKQYASIAALSPTKVVIAYKDSSDAYSAIYGVLLTISGTTIIPGTRNTLDTGGGIVQHLSLVKVSTTKAFLACMNGYASRFQYMLIGTTDTAAYAISNTVANFSFGSYRNDICFATPKFFPRLVAENTVAVVFPYQYGTAMYYLVGIGVTG